MAQNFQNDHTRVNSFIEFNMLYNVYGSEKLPYFPDRIVHHCIVQVLEPIWMKTLIGDTWASMKGRGIHKGVYRIKAALRDIENTKYCLKFDIKQFKQGEGALKVLFTGSDVLIDQMEKYKEYVPFLTTIKKINRYYSFS